MELHELQQRIYEHYTKKLPFVLYADPQESDIEAMFQHLNRANENDDLLESGFVFAPFAEGKRLFIPVAGSDCVAVKFSSEVTPQQLPPQNPISEEKASYLTLVQKAKKSIAAGKHAKIVTSRSHIASLTNFSLETLLSRVFGLYQNAFRYIWYHPDTGIWCGATPEVLLKTNGIEFSTMALAGTRKYQADRDPRWESKEIDEQKWVVDAITSKLECAASVIRVSSVRNHKAGSLVHLRTDFNGVFKKGCMNVANLVNALHPTPAICGTPDDKAMEFILQHENYNRSYYTGFLGVVNACENKSTFYVNLRCMQINETQAQLYVGGGITFDSIPEEEWTETENKLQTMLQVIAPML